MKSQAVDDLRDEATDAERLMGLLALTVQELPHAPGHANEVADGVAALSNEQRFQHLDANPAVLEVYLHKGMRPQRHTKLVAESHWQQKIQALAKWFVPPRVRFAAAFSVVLLAGVVTYWQWSARSLLDTVERSYADINLLMPANALLLPWQQSVAVQGFSALPGNDSPAGRAFAQGLMRGQSRLTGIQDDSQQLGDASGTESYVALGEWNVLLWASTQSADGHDADFWRGQLDLARKLRAAFESNDLQAIETHLTTADTLLDEMKTAANPRTARRLADELTRFREGFSPHVPPDYLPTPAR